MDQSINITLTEFIGRSPDIFLHYIFARAHVEGNIPPKDGLSEENEFIIDNLFLLLMKASRYKCHTLILFFAISSKVYSPLFSHYCS